MTVRTMPYGTVLLEHLGATALIRLNRPDRLNAYTPEMGEDLVTAFRATAMDKAVRAVIVTGEGRSFCAGADRDCFSAPPGSSGLRIGEEAFVSGFAAELHAHPKLTIAAFHGAAVGIGVTMSLCLDIRLAAEDAMLKLNFAENGIMPGFGATFLLPHLVGAGQAKRMLLSEPVVNAERAQALGLVDELCPKDRLIDRAIEIAEGAAKFSAEAVTGIKLALNKGMESGFAAALANEAASTLRKGAGK